jgi:hypothetical protein
MLRVTHEPISALMTDCPLAGGLKEVMPSSKYTPKIAEETWSK